MKKILIVEDAKNGDVRAQEYIISKYESFVKAKAKSYFLIGADKEDIYQEGMIGLYKAIRDIKFEKIGRLQITMKKFGRENKRSCSTK